MLESEDEPVGVVVAASRADSLGVLGSKEQPKALVAESPIGLTRLGNVVREIEDEARSLVPGPHGCWTYALPERITVEEDGFAFVAGLPIRLTRSLLCNVVWKGKNNARRRMLA